MKGATAVPSVKKIKKPNKKRKMIIGANHHFFLSSINSIISFIMDNFDIQLVKNLSYNKFNL